ncbi:hypothetical protein FEM21_10910 [Flavobacterium seoulense]|uniref:Uncharacterized protein n=1 Tax=Flavobacterium seoulense TaxID=1492738 RepID=A0A066WZ26_9FLAO|nr:hypothetical protein FEM21_10910 [Flavobacterium seoulense]
MFLGKSKTKSQKEMKLALAVIYLVPLSILMGIFSIIQFFKKHFKKSKKTK